MSCPSKLIWTWVGLQGTTLTIITILLNTGELGALEGIVRPLVVDPVRKRLVRYNFTTITIHMFCS